MRRVLPPSRRGRVLGFGLFTGAVGGALFVHDLPSFDFSILEPEWLTVALFVALPLLFGLVAAWSVETLDSPGGRLRRLPRWLVVLLALPLAAPTVVITGPVVLVAFGVAVSARPQALWQSRLVTLAGSALYVVLVAWACTPAADVLSIAADRPGTAPLVL